jgi:hypothetical protein
LTLDPASTDRRFDHLPPACRAFFSRALAVDVAMRPRSPAAFITELAQSLHG